MNILEVLATAAVGSFLGIIGKELFDLVKERQRHRLQLRSRYFEEKLVHTLGVVKMVKSVTTLVRDFGHDSARTLETVRGSKPSRNPAPNDAVDVLRSTSAVVRQWTAHLQQVQEQLEDIAKNDAVVRSSTGFFYGPRWDSVWTRFEQQLDETTDQLTNLGRAFAEGAAKLNSADSEPIDVRVAAFVKCLHAEVDQFAQSAQALDAAADAVVESMRKDFKAVAF